MIKLGKRKKCNVGFLFWGKKEVRVQRRDIERKVLFLRREINQRTWLEKIGKWGSRFHFISYTLYILNFLQCL